MFYNIFKNIRLPPLAIKKFSSPFSLKKIPLNHLQSVEKEEARIYTQKKPYLHFLMIVS
jgi:hypothetical protein